MALFSKRPRTLVPAEILSQLNSFGNASWEAKLNSRPINDPRFDWTNFFAKFLAAYQTNLAQAIADLHAAAGADPLARYGGYQLVAEFEPESTDPLFLDMMDTGLQMMFDRGLSSLHMNWYEQQRWTSVHGDLHTSFDRLVEVAPPADAEASVELEPGQSLMVAMLGPGALDNQFWVERIDASTYGVFSMRPKDSDAVVLMRSEEEWIGKTDSLSGILRNLGAFLRTPSYWVHPDLDPYFTERRLS